MEMKTITTLSRCLALHFKVKFAGAPSSVLAGLGSARIEWD